MDDWAWEQLEPWLQVRVKLPVGPLFCVVSAAPAPPRPRRRDGPRGRVPDRHPTPARPHQPRHHLDLPPRHRQHRDHRHGPRAPRTDGPRRQLARALTSRPAAGKPRLARRRSSPGSPARNPWRAARRALHCRERANPRGVRGLLTFRRSSTHAPITLSCASRRLRKRRPCEGTRRDLSARPRSAYANAATGRASLRGCSSTMAGAVERMARTPASHVDVEPSRPQRGPQDSQTTWIDQLGSGQILFESVQVNGGWVGR
jgi:hypothetical protein